MPGLNVLEVESLIDHKCFDKEQVGEIGGDKKSAPPFSAHSILKDSFPSNLRNTQVTKTVEERKFSNKVMKSKRTLR